MAINNDSDHRSDHYPPKSLAIDYGTKRIGLAVSQAALSEPLLVLQENNYDEILAQIKKICTQLNVEQLVLGLSEQKMADKTRRFGEKLKQDLKLPLEYVDETLSSARVKHVLKERKKLLHGRPIDHYSAALILDNWLDDWAE